jgi:hypothetical protein
MCNVCCANDALTPGGFTSAWKKAPKKITLEAWSKGAEFEPYVASITREGDDSIWVKGTDLAGLASRLGLEIKWKYAKKKGMKRWLKSGDRDILFEQLLKRSTEIEEIAKWEADAFREGLSAAKDEPVKDESIKEDNEDEDSGDWGDALEEPVHPVYILSSFDDVFQEVPANRVEDCMSAIGAAIIQAKRLRKTVEGAAPNAAPVRLNPMRWTDDGKPVSYEAEMNDDGEMRRFIRVSHR